MPGWEIAVIVIVCVIGFVLINSLACFILVNVRLFEINFLNSFEFKFSGYREDKERMIKDFDWFNSQNFEWLEMRSFDGLKLKAALLKVENSNKFMLCFHGYRSKGINDFSSSMQFYRRLGYNVLIVNQRSHGKSRGIGITFGIKEKYDCRDWVDFIDKKFNPKEIVLSGVSMGAATVMMASGLNLSKKVKCVIADCGYTTPNEIICATIKNLKLPLYPTIWFVKFYVKLFLKISFKSDSTIEALKKSNIPTIFIHGTKDKLVPCRMSVENFEAKKDKKKMVLIDGASHAGAYLKDSEKYEKEVESFLKEC